MIPDDPSHSTEDKTSTDSKIIEDKVMSLFSAEAGMSTVDVSEKQTKCEFTVKPTCSEIPVL